MRFNLTGRRRLVDRAYRPVDRVILPLDTSRAPVGADIRRWASKAGNHGRFPELQ